ncbi:hypothetical protein LTR53_016068 [Teratosphaeriaceae sp. CCFEE 6253]|nr:hypothetical protein LTR53_016068 [Teratosphaeriaceae sp. CCFEE 6253]
MWDGLPMLLFLCIVMGTASFLAGILPLTLSLSPRQLRLITALGTGVLVGTALVIIIPEGVETLYEAGGSRHSHAGRAVAIRREPASWFGLATRGVLMSREDVESSKDLFPGLDGDSPIAPSDLVTTATNALPDEGEIASEQPTDPEGYDVYDDEDDGHDREPHAWVGLSLVSGFVLMYLIDMLPRHATASQPRRFSISLNSFSFENARPSSSASAVETPTQATFDSSVHAHSGGEARPSSTTIGLVIHGAADGIALGASSTTTSRLTFIIFLALMIHKAPAAFGLTSVLLKQGLSKRGARAHLIIFSLAAPVGALLTWSGAHLLGYSSSVLGDSTNTEFATGVLLLFSGGTFLYVAVHTMQESSSGHSDGGEAEGNGYTGVSSMEDGSGIYGQAAKTAREEKPGLTDTLVTVGGMLLPLLLGVFGHGH